MDFVEGRYRLVLQEGDFHGPEPLYHEARGLPALVTGIERILDAAACHRL